MFYYRIQLYVSIFCWIYNLDYILQGKREEKGIILHLYALFSGGHNIICCVLLQHLFYDNLNNGHYQRNNKNILY